MTRRYHRTFSRRRAIRILAVAAGAPLVAAVVRPAPAQFHVWRGEALGAEAGLTLWQPDGEHARRIIEHCRAAGVGSWAGLGRGW